MMHYHVVEWYLMLYMVGYKVIIVNRIWLALTVFTG
uniref:Uncharacterized protein n=1 Tax=Rhizophora mucronata TaxID=61149 RepID=A0A2P2JNE8_RHIMU